MPAGGCASMASRLAFWNRPTCIRCPPYNHRRIARWSRPTAKEKRVAERRVGRRSGLTSYGDEGFSTFMRRAFAKGMGYTDEDLRRPVIGICNSWSELNHCNTGLRALAEAVKRGVWQAGGWPLEFPTISLGEIFISPTAMLYRNLMAMDTEEMI